MKEEIKQIFSLNTVLIAYICAIGYGIGYAVPEYMGYSMWICIIPSFIIGTIFYEVGMKVLNSNYFNNSPKRKIIFTVLFYGCYWIISLSSVRYLGHDIDYDFFINLGFVILFQIVAFIIRYFKIKKSNQPL